LFFPLKKNFNFILWGGGKLLCLYEKSQIRSIININPHFLLLE